MSAIFLRRNSVMNFVFFVILALSALRSGDADGCTSPYDNGPYTVEKLYLNLPIAQSVRFLWIVVPTAEGKFPVVQFQHGFQVRNTCYNQLISHVASYGFIVVAPQMDSGLSFNATHEIRDAIDVLKWIQANIECALSVGGPEIKPDLSKLALVGHSRGAKVVFSMGIQLNGTIPISAIIGLDPVDGDRQGIQTNPPVLTFKENTLNLTVPTLIVGTRRGSKNWPLFPPCAPEDVNHNEFYKDLIEPVYHFVVGKEYGHMDFLDDAVCKLRSLGCMGTVGSRAQMSRFAGGVVAAFLQATVGNNPCYFNYALTNYTSAPVNLEVPEQKGELPHNHNLQVPLKDE
ncbi:unnamed protein product [Sphagnum jensenii]|uniref:Chlorophyllase n=1 Tax=Sphagnum jensenii TaxID=128206 RepID=A0ABP1A271_9BRYO